MKKLIITFKHLLVLIWILFILIIFKITTNFVFKNGTSIIFILLLCSFTIFIYVYSLLEKRKVRKKRILLLNGYYEIIKKDFKNENFKIKFLDKLVDLKLEYKVLSISDFIEVHIYKKNELIMIVYFDSSKATLVINNTQIYYNYYYSSKYDEFTKYDLRYFEYQDSHILYVHIIDKITSLINHRYLYILNKKNKMLINKDNNEIIYEIAFNKKLLQKTKKIKKEIIL